MSRVLWEQEIEAQFPRKIRAALDAALAEDLASKVGFKEIRLRFDITSDAPQEKLDELLALTERYCVIYDTLRSSPRMNVAMNTAKS